MNRAPPEGTPKDRGNRNTRGAHMETDVTAYAAAERMFSMARRAVTDLPSLMAELDSHSMLHSGIAEAAGRAGDGQDALIGNLAKHAELVARIERDIAESVDAVADARAVVAEVEDPGDATVLRLYYLAGMSERQIPRHEEQGEPSWQYSPGYVHEKKAMALMHSAPVMRRLGLVSKYS